MQQTGIVKVKKIFLAFITCLLVMGALRFLFIHDNKYTARSPITSEGRTFLSHEKLSRNSLSFLVEGWELYPDRLLSAEEMNPPFFRSFIGEHLTFSDFHQNRSPYGTMTYRLKLEYDGEPDVYTLLLPEVFSAASVYVDGRLVASAGSLDPYSPSIQDLLCDIPLKKQSELVVQTANYTHYYSGITYPPVLGTAQAIYGFTSRRMMIYGFLCFSSLAIALFSSSVWIGTRSLQKDRIHLWFAGLSLSFALRIIYPFLHLSALPLIRAFYALEDGASLFGILCALNIVLILDGLEHTRAARLLTRISLGMIAVGIIIPLFLLSDLPAFTAVYGSLISWYKLITALLLCILSLARNAKSSYFWLTAGSISYGLSLLFTTVSFNRFEPVYGCWPDEYGTYILVICFAILMVMRSHSLIQEHAKLTYHLQEEVDKQTRQISGLVEERQKLLSEFLHDLKSPVTSLMTYAKLIRKNKILLDPSTETQLEYIEQKSLDVNRQIKEIQDFTAENPMVSTYSDIDLHKLLSDFYRYNKPDIEVNGPDFILNLPPASCCCTVHGDWTKLTRVLQNLVYNAVSFTPEDGTISLSLKKESTQALITVTDNGCGIPMELQSKVFLRSFSTRKEEGGKGLGLYICKTIVSEHGGEIWFQSEPGKGTSFYIRLPVR